ATTVAAAAIRFHTVIAHTSPVVPGGAALAQPGTGKVARPRRLRRHYDGSSHQRKRRDDPHFIQPSRRRRPHSRQSPDPARAGPLPRRRRPFPTPTEALRRRTARGDLTIAAGGAAACRGGTTGRSAPLQRDVSPGRPPR